MSLKIVYGTSGTGKSKYIYNEIKEKLRGNFKNSIKIITPEQFSFTAEKELLGISENKCVIQAEVITFNRMAYRILQEVGGKAVKHISNSGKNMILKHILLNKKNEFTYLGKNDDNVELVSRQLTELKKHNIGIEDLKKSFDATESMQLKKKIEDVTNIYEKYNSQIQGKYLDENDCLTVLAEKLEMSDEFKNCDIYLDEFVGFTLQEYDILKVLLKISNSVTITICADNLESNTNPDVDIFYTNKQTAKRIMKIAKDESIQIEEPIKLDKSYRFKNKELKHLAENIEVPFYEKYDKKVDNISLFLANNAYTEMENVAIEITKLVKENGYRYEDIAIVTKDIATYSSLCKAIFKKYEIPVFIDEKKDLSQNIVIQYILSLLDIFAKNWSYESIMGYVKTGFTNLEINEISILENYSIAFGLKGSKWYANEWKFYDETEEERNTLIYIKGQLVEPLLKFKESLRGYKTVEQITKGIYNFLIDNEIPEKLEYKIEKLEKIGELEIANQYRSSWKIVIEILEEIIDVLGEKTITFEEYSKILKMGFESTELGAIPGTADQVILGDTQRSRTHKVRACYIIGLNDGIFPGNHKDEGFLDDNDREILKENGIELAKGTMEQLYDDHFNIYKAFTTAEEKVYLSYISSNNSGESLRPSILVNKVKKIFEQIEKKSDIITRKSEILLENSTFDELLINLRNFTQGEEIEPIWFDVYNYYKKYSEEKLNKSIKALEFKNLPEKIEKEKIDKLYGDNLKTSVSRLERYESCPFSYYLQYGLKLKEQNTMKVEVVDTGSFMHEVIDEFFSVLTQRNINIKDKVNERNELVKGITDEQIEDITKEIVEEKLQLRKYDIFQTIPKYRILAQRIKRVVTKSIKYIVFSLKNSSFEVLGHEVEFKEGKELKPIVLELEDGKKVEVRGKIDRIDIAKMPDGNYIRIIDYKSSVKNINLSEVLGGLQLQLLTYLNVAVNEKDLLPAAALYFPLIDPVLREEKNISEEEIKSQIQNQYKMNGLILADANVIKEMDTSTANGYLKTVNAQITKDGNLRDKPNILNRKQFEYLQAYVEKLIKQISTEIYSGKIDITPYYKKQGIRHTPCEYCKYKPICNFNEVTKNDYRYITEYTKENAMEEIKKNI